MKPENRRSPPNEGPLPFAKMADGFSPVRRFQTSLSRLSVESTLALIGFYKQRISPHKGFSCAHRVLHHGSSCSSHAVELIQTVGVFGAVAGMRKRFAECRAAAEAIRTRHLALSALGPETLHVMDPSCIGGLLFPECLMCAACCGV